MIRTARPDPGNGWRAKDLFRNAQFPSDQSHFIFEQLAQRLDQFQIHLLRQAADVVMALDHG